MSKSANPARREDVDLANLRQRQASDPAFNVYVSANAGSGKTRVLVDRVSRLLLQPHTTPDKILCLTYTKAAAAEMQRRLYEALGKWSVMEDGPLQEALAKLDGNAEPRTPRELRAARELFAKALETPEGLKVQTLHAFCERILRRFPLEVGIAPGFDSLDDKEARQILAQVKAQVYTRALGAPDAPLAKAISLLASQHAEATLDGLLSWAAQNSFAVQAWEAGAKLSALAGKLGVDPGLTRDEVKQAAWQAAPKGAIKAAADELSKSGLKNQALAQIIYSALEQTDDQVAYELYTEAFLTKAGAPRAAISHSNIALELFGGGKKHPYGQEAIRMFTAIDKVKAAATLEKTAAVYTIAVQAVTAYEAVKRARRVMDFNDQIMLARRLLCDSAASEWVKYKLDGGVDHVLIDEAQDTSPEQWDIVDAVSEEFGAVENSGRTKFAVGDEKQSIYSFQGARPELFLSRTQTGMQTGAQADERSKAVPMTMSFRSSPYVLDMVDAVFVQCGAGEQIFDAPPAGDIPRHSAYREDDGRVELWPLAPAPDGKLDETAWEFTPVDALDTQSSRERLAAQIAQCVRGWLDTGEGIYDRDKEFVRAIEPGDIMILARKRGPFFDAIIRHLKLAHVPVSGADKLKLTDHIGVQDLISLGKFLCLQSDDLSLAEVLKSPIFGLDDDALMRLAIGRNGTLWDALCQHSAPEFFEARASLRRFLKLKTAHAPYELYARILSTLMPPPPGQDSGERQSVQTRFYARLGLEVTDPIEAFLSRALSHQRLGPPSLERFLRDLEGDDAELKREMDAEHNEVRVMTVHGAKGLETPVVILPDTTQTPKEPARTFDMDALSENVGDGFVMRQPAKDIPAALADITQLRERRALQESLRLFYVAMTRAESRLVICGFESGAKKQAAEHSWYEWAQRGFEHLDGVKEQLHSFGTVKTYGPAVQLAPNSHAQSASAALPKWAHSPHSTAARGPLYVTPSHLLAGPDMGEPAVRSPLGGLGAETQRGAPAALGPFGRGNIIHKLLEILPPLAPDRRGDVARAYLNAQPAINAQQAEQITAEVFTVLEHADFAHIFTEQSRAEVSLAGSTESLPDGLFMNAQIDRLVVSEREVWIVDYKSNRPPPQHEDDVAPIYIAQMAAYRALAQDIYPKKTIRCALLWTDGPFLMELSASRLAKFDFASALT